MDRKVKMYRLDSWRQVSIFAQMIETTNYSFLYANGTFKDIVPPNKSDTVVVGINGYRTVVGITNLSSGSPSYFTAHSQ